MMEKEGVKAKAGSADDLPLARWPLGRDGPVPAPRSYLVWLILKSYRVLVFPPLVTRPLPPRQVILKLLF